MHDGQMVIVFALLIEEGRKVCADRPEFLESLDVWYDGFANWISGVSDICLKGVWETVEGQQLLLSLLDHVQVSLKEHEGTVPRDFVIRITRDPNWRDVPVDFIDDAIVQIRDFVRCPDTNGIPLSTFAPTTPPDGAE